jgi:hypothetical protein
MLVRETIETCAKCEARTPHSRRRVSLPKLAALASVAAVGGFALAESEVALLGAVFVPLALYLALREDERAWRSACERCRHKWLGPRREKRRQEREARRKSGPTFDGNIEINLFTIF